MDPEPNEHSTGGVSVPPRQPPSKQMGPDVQVVSAGGDSGTGPLAELGWRSLAWSRLGNKIRPRCPTSFWRQIFFFGPFVFCRLVCFLHDLGPNEVGPTLGVIYGACCMFLFLTVL